MEEKRGEEKDGSRQLITLLVFWSFPVQYIYTVLEPIRGFFMQASCSCVAYKWVNLRQTEDTQYKVEFPTSASLCANRVYARPCDALLRSFIMQSLLIVSRTNVQTAMVLPEAVIIEDPTPHRIFS